jgi:deoxyribodipyrimidine photo-lyase
MNTKRIQSLNKITYASGSVVYWMSREQRVKDNWALLYAQETAKKYNTSFSVIFCLRKSFDKATERLIDFMIKGLEEVERNLANKNIQFFFLLGDPEEEIPEFIKKNNSGFLISDFSPLRYNRSWKKGILKKISIPFHEVDAHNIIPIWEASDHQEYGAYTIHPKIHRLLPEYLEKFPQVSSQDHIVNHKFSLTDWGNIKKQIICDMSVNPVDWINPGEESALESLKNFLETRMDKYDEERNDPTKNAQSQLSPFIHFGHIASQRIALEVQKSISNKNTLAFLEELIVRKELSDNYCYYNTNYDNPSGFPDWARKTLEEHSYDKRLYLYSLSDLENIKTHDDLWNAAQREMMERGKMHGYMRMYWAKKIYEWSPNVTIAQKYALFLNDKYFLDGRDPNGYAGIAWSLGGVHDRAWYEKDIFGKIRYMSYNGAKSKFNIQHYINNSQKFPF